MILIKRVSAGLTASLAAVALVGCAHATEVAEDSHANGNGSSRSGHHYIVGAEYPDQDKYPTWNASDKAAALDRAEAVMKDFTKPTKEKDAWWAQVRSHLSAQAQTDYQGVDPDNVPATKVTGEGKIIDDSSAYLVWVEVPTDIGPYEVLVSRADAEDSWHVERMTPPEND